MAHRRDDAERGADEALSHLTVEVVHKSRCTRRRASPFIADRTLLEALPSVGSSRPRIQRGSCQHNWLWPWHERAGRFGETVDIDSLPGRAGNRCHRLSARPSDGTMALTLVLFFGSAVAIYLSCEFFVNGVEWVGQRLKITQTATGTILAAFGTALPESVVTFVAVVFGTTDAKHDIGVGAAIGRPLAPATLSFGGVAL